MEISRFLKTGIELSYFAHTDTWVLSEKSESFGVCVKRIEITEVFIDSVHWFLFRSGNEKNMSISTLNSVFFCWWHVSFNRVSLFDISNGEWNFQRWINCNWSWSSYWSSLNWLWSSFNDWLCFGLDLWFSKVFIVGLGKFLILIFSKLSSLNINKLYVVNFFEPFSSWMV